MQVSEPTEERRSDDVAREYRALIAHAEAPIARTTRRLAEQQAALASLRAALARHEHGNGNGNGFEPFDTGDGEGHKLTPRQLEILRYLGEGFSTSQIAGRLWLSAATVRNHVSGILAALECHSRLEAVAQARRRGLL
jgi:DNA-binding NarL/FixJ family response regulator